ncbi:Ribose operon repressor [Pantoea agglomerans]|uniref:Ribose operon repressor n=1 Tax=Enterobacter agglomerans TaxID=549 RepID=A0A379A8P6_ENTAG|nr:Ribose operon repressor [Pantoea agglomerans]
MPKWCGAWEESCYQRGYSLILCNTAGDEERMNRSLETLMQKRVGRFIDHVYGKPPALGRHSEPLSLYTCRYDGLGAV